MKADLTRDSFYAYKNFSRVLMQQGRVQLDADWNEQTSILLHYLRTMAADIIGPLGSPSGDAGFNVAALDASLNAANDFVIGPGRLYVDGYLLEISPQSIPYSKPEGSSNKIAVAALSADGGAFAAPQLIQLSGISGGPLITRVTDVGVTDNTLTVAADLSNATVAPGATLQRVTTYLTQPFLPVSQTLPVGESPVFIDVWERAITYVQDDSVREVALLGPDTGARAQVVWQVRASNPDAVITRAFRSGGRGEMKAIAKQPVANTDPCTLPADARYRGPENQLYRVEIHTGGLASEGATFKWSRENGSVVFPILRSSGSNSVVLENLGRDDRFGLEQGDWVEASDNATELLAIARPLLQVQSIDRTTKAVTLSGPVGITFTKGNPNHPFLRRWDLTFGDPAEGGLQKAGDNAAVIVEDSATWLNLENGIQVQFQKPASGQVRYRTGDYWLIPARTALGDIVWPQQIVIDSQGNTIQTPVAKPPDGIEHHIAQIGSITTGTGGQVTNATSSIVPFNPQG